MRNIGGILVEQQWMEDCRLTFKLCSLFLRYPDQEWTESTELQQIIKSIDHRGIQTCLSQFLLYVQDTPMKALCENYVRWFDFSDQTTLYLTHDLFGETRERGLAFVKLKMEFAKADFYIKNDELPDYLPLILEFASEANEKFVQKVFLIHKKAIDQLLSELERNENPYANVLKACVIAMAAFMPVQDGANVNHHAG